MASEVDVDELKSMNQQQLDDLFAGSPAGPIRAGVADDTVLFDPGTAQENVAAKVPPPVLEGHWGRRRILSLALVFQQGRPRPRPSAS